MEKLLLNTNSTKLSSHFGVLFRARELKETSSLCHFYTFVILHGRIHHWGKRGNFLHQDFDPWNLLGNFPSKNPVQTLSRSMFDFLYPKFATPERNSGPNPQTFQFLVEGTLDPNSQETSGMCLVSPVALKPRIRRCHFVMLKLG